MVSCEVNYPIKDCHRDLKCRTKPLIFLVWNQDQDLILIYRIPVTLPSLVFLFPYILNRHQNLFIQILPHKHNQLEYLRVNREPNSLYSEFLWIFRQEKDLLEIHHYKTFIGFLLENHPKILVLNLHWWTVQIVHLTVKHSIIF